MSYGRRITLPPVTLIAAGRTYLADKHTIGLAMLVSALLLSGCGGAGGTATTTGTTTGATTGTTTGPATAALQIVWKPLDFVPLSYSLDCEPASGTVVDPSAACAAISQNLNMLVERPPVVCAEDGASLRVSGVYDGRPVDVGFIECADVELGGWKSFLPTEGTLEEVSTDQGLGPFTLGESEPVVRALLAGDQAIGTAAGLDVYKPTGGLPGLISESCAGSPQDRLIMAFRYGSASGLTTVITNERNERLEGENLRELAIRCEGEGTGDPHEVPPRLQGVLPNWVHVTCGGQEALADHPLPEDTTVQDTTIVIPALLPLVIVTSDPASACEDAARLHAEYGA